MCFQIFKKKLFSFISDINECENITCLHGGHCIDGINKFTCNCTRFFSGRICEKGMGTCKQNIYRQKIEIHALSQSLKREHETVSVSTYQKNISVFIEITFANVAYMNLLLKLCTLKQLKQTKTGYITKI